MNGRKSLFDSLNQTMDSLSGVGLEEKAKKEYRAVKRNSLIITFVIIIVCGGILYFHFNGYNCTVLAVVLLILDVLSFLWYLFY